MPKPKTVQIQKGDARGECLEPALAAWLRNGWTAVDDGSSESGTTPVVEQVEPAVVEVQPDENEGEVQ